MGKKKSKNNQAKKQAAQKRQKAPQKQQQSLQKQQQAAQKQQQALQKQRQQVKKENEGQQAPVSKKGKGRRKRRDFNAVSNEDHIPRQLDYGSDHHTELVFNPSTVNNRELGDEDLTLIDPPSVNGNDENDTLVEDEVSAYGVDIFLKASKRVRRGRPSPAIMCSPVQPRKGLWDLYTEYPDEKLSGIEAEVLELAGQAAKQVVLEATYHFLQKCIPTAEREKIWGQVMKKTSNGASDDAVTSIPVPHGVLDSKNGTRQLHQLMANCITTLSSSFTTADATSLRLVFNRCITLCNALDDLNRQAALEKALHALDWLILGLDVKTTHAFRNLNEVLDTIDWGFLKKPGTDARLKRSRFERRILRNHKKLWENTKAPLRMKFLEALQELVRQMSQIN
ncbi:hypothetical protein M406DRAFT_69601 [Cryphonectria parasitica EP155]|uniref:Uncharacterized protein n=1 Tax=Cryphonectria parasitica (strain ATCC 38755 / EP155) TaxID=660469 RepID=A0A9P4Y6W0_CRYP1|nr:uncharacterized protein M406DRAFT_69601 [Cryphonectria parasitica EP155]KAF3767457.1 hypothetical protein M406DRAFT_69601 [Cryphonectria parasitica EP155]